MGGSNQYEGRVEMCLGGSWTSVCSEVWSNQETSVVCSQLGLAANGVNGKCACVSMRATRVHVCVCVCACVCMCVHVHVCTC